MNNRVTQSGVAPATELPTRESRRGFTLIELLVVISIIALLAGLVVGLSGTASQKSRAAAASAQLHKLTTAISDYKGQLGFYPPDGGDRLNPQKNPLYYELMGTVRKDGTFRTLDSSQSINQTGLNAFFGSGVSGFSNASDDPKEVKKFISLSANEHKIVQTSPEIQLLVGPVNWNPPPADPVQQQIQNYPGVDNKTVNPWRYISNSPTNNATGFDLWLEYYSGGKLKTIGNW